jgi:gliding motility-associated-like protein
MKLLRIYPLPVDFMPPDSSLCKGNILQIKVPGYLQYNWTTGSHESFIDISLTGTYGLQVIDDNNCKGMDSTKVFFYTNCITIQVPNAFTPNGDGKNDVFKPLIPAPVRNYNFKIWNRWGLMLFETQNQDKGWDGRIQSREQGSGVFIYLITFRDLDGRNVKRSGTIVLIR